MMQSSVSGMMNGEHEPTGIQPAPGPSPSQSQPVNPESPVIKKRRARIPNACRPCKNRKTRCDGRKPICIACESRDISDSCVYEAPRQRRTAGSISNSQDNESRPVQTPTASAVLHTTYGQLQTPTASSVSPVAGVEAHGEKPWSTAQPDGLATLAGNNDNSIYGPSSTVAFLRHVLSDTDAIKPAPVHPTVNGSNLAKIQPLSLERLPERNLAAAVLPRRRSADDFVACYWEFIHPMFPVLHKPTFLRQYDQFWRAETSGRTELVVGSENEEMVLLATLNLVFALGSKFSDQIPPAQKPATADDFYQRSRQLFAYDMLDASSLAMVQMLLLTGIYLQSTQHSSRCWNSVGLAIRAAQGIGLHLDSRRSHTQLEREMRRRVWYTCVNLDRLLAMTFGRPTMVAPGTDIPIPALIDDEYLTSSGRDGTQPPNIHSRLGLFVHSCSLLELLGEVLRFLSQGDKSKGSRDSAHGSKVDPSDGELVSHVLDLNRRLDQFSATVPAYLRVSAGSSPIVANHVRLQQQILYCRFLLTRLLLLRPLLLMTTRQEPTSPFQALDGAAQSTLDNEMVRQCCNLCARTAHLLIGALHDNIGTLYRSTGWHAVYFAFSAAIVLIASAKCHLVDIAFGDAAFETSWDRCLTILRHYEVQIPSARHAVHSLTSIRQQMGGRSQTLPPLSNPPYHPAHQSKDVNMTDTLPDQQWGTFGIRDEDFLGFDGLSEAWMNMPDIDWFKLPGA